MHKNYGTCTIDGNFDINGNYMYMYHGNRAQQPIKIKVSMVTMVVTIDGKVTINGKLCATGPRNVYAPVFNDKKYSNKTYSFCLISFNHLTAIGSME